MNWRLEAHLHIIRNNEEENVFFLASMTYVGKKTEAEHNGQEFSEG